MTAPLAAPRTRMEFWPTLLLLLACVFASRLVWYDLRVVRRELLQPGQMRVFFLAYAACLVPLLLVILGRSLTRAVLTSPSGWFFFLAWYGLIPALIYRNDLVLVAQDIFKLSLLPAGYLGARLVFQGTHAVSTSRARRFCWRLSLCVVAFQLLRFGLHYTLKRSSAPLVYGTVLDVIPVAMLAAIVLLGRGKNRLLALALAGISLALVLPGQKRTVLGCVVIAAAFLVCRTMRRRPVLALVLSYLIVLVAGGALLFGGVDALLESESLKRVSTTEVTTTVGTESWRFAELQTVAAHLDAGGPTAWLFGYGHGASFRIWHPVRGLQVVHSVHHTPAAMVLRYGFLGLLFYFALAGYVLRTVLRREKRTDSEALSAVLGAKAYLLAALFASLVIFGFVDDLLVGACAALVRSLDKSAVPGPGRAHAREQNS